MIGIIVAVTFQFSFMACAIDVIDRHDPGNEMRRQWRDPGNEMCRQLQPKKTKVRLCYPFI